MRGFILGELRSPCFDRVDRRTRILQLRGIHIGGGLDCAGTAHWHNCCRGKAAKNSPMVSDSTIPPAALPVIRARV